MFFAALMSRSCRVPQDGHCHVRVLRDSSASKCPHELHVLELGYHLSITIRCRPALAALYSTMRRKAPQPQGQMPEQGGAQPELAAANGHRGLKGLVSRMNRTGS